MEAVISMQQSMLTTVDNPYDPFDEYDAWHSHDMWLGHHTAEFLARLVVSSHELSEADYWLSVDQTIDEIIKNNVTGVFRKVTREIEK